MTGGDKRDPSAGKMADSGAGIVLLCTGCHNNLVYFAYLVPYLSLRIYGVALHWFTGEDICEAIYSAKICEAVVVGAGGTAALALTPALLATLGFTSTGIAAGSIAAKLMSFFAALNGGGVAAGGVVSILQSLGAGGLSWFSGGVVGGTGATMGWLLSAICNQTRTD